MVGKKYYVQKEDVSPDVLEAICSGLECTDEVPKGVKKAYLDWPED